jgi:CRISPR-associated protein Csm5
MNKPFMETVQCSISTLSPVHIGCGEDYHPTNYVIDGGFLHCFGEDGLLAALNDNEKQQLIELSEKASLAANDKNQKSNRYLQELQSLIYNKKDQLQSYASHSVPISSQLADFYKTRIGKTLQNDEINRLGIARHTFNPYSQTPYFPGSSIKGAIRTAILNAVNGGRTLQEVLDALGITDRQGNPFIADKNTNIPKFVNDKLQKSLLDFQRIQDDPLRLLKIGDANYQHPNGLHGLEIRFAVNRKNWSSVEIPTVSSMAEQQGLYQLLECLPANRSRSLLFDVTFLAGGKYPWTMAIITRVCNDFFKPQLEKELALMRELNYANSKWITDLENLLAGELGDALNNQQAFLLRIGQHSGAVSNTLDGVRHISVKISDKPAKYEYRDKPSTIWLAANHQKQKSNLLPFGWILIEVGKTCLEKTAAFLSNQCHVPVEIDATHHDCLQHSSSTWMDEIANMEEKKLILAFSKGYNKTKTFHEKLGHDWQEVINLIWTHHAEKINSWVNSKDTNPKKAYQKLSEQLKNG